MRGAITRRAVLLLAAALTASLVALAYLQYRWIAQLGASERALLDASIERGARNFREEFNAEVSTLVDRTMRGPDRGPEAFAARFHSASGSLKHPQIAHVLYLSTGTHLFEATISKLNPVEWPQYLQPLLSRIRDPGNGPPPRPFWNESPPAIVLPGVPEPRRGPPPRGDGEGDDRPPPGPPGGAWIIFEFDPSYIRSQLIPELIAKHFGPDYDIEVTSNSGDAHDTRIVHPDASVGFFEIHMDRPRDRHGKGPPRGDHPEPPRPPLFETPRWQLLVKHQSGSLDLQVTSARRRNLAITSAVLLIMALSSAALIVWLKRAEQLNRMQMDFVAGVSHELRTPLSVIRAAGENLADGVVANEKQIRNYGGLVRDEGRRLSTMVEQILRFAGVESGRAPYTFTPVSAARIVDRALEESRATLEYVEVEKQVEAGLPNIMADEASLSHCLQNLLGNAVKYGGGRWVKVEASRKGGEVEFAVTDRGPGVDPSDKPNLFNPFFRGKKAINAQIRGLGVGLSLVKRVAEAHGGRADVKNVAQGGARFSIFLPVERPERT